MGLFGSKDKKKKGQDGTVDNTVAEAFDSATVLSTVPSCPIFFLSLLPNNPIL